MFISNLKEATFVKILSCLICISADLFLTSCDINSGQVPYSEKAPIATAKPDDLSHLFSFKGRERVELVERNLLGKDYLPGGKWPTYYSKAKGISIWDLNGKKYLDFTMVGIGTSVLGYSDKDINKRAIKAIKSG